jgi:hypothetical protein
MVELTVTVGENEYVFEFEQEPTEQQIVDAMKTIGGRTRRD